MPRNKSGKVFLVGAGPGDPSLITRRGWDLVLSADALVVDDLVHPFFSHVNAAAEVIYVGKRGPAAPGGRVHVCPQNKINSLLIRLARSGKCVVRLKGGDPLVFGRGGEEMEAMAAAKIPFDVVPGVSSVSAAPAAAGVPLSDRRWASSVTVVTGQESRDEESSSGVAWRELPRSGTLVVLMGVQAWPRIQKKLVAAGWPGSTPVAVIESATTARQRIHIGRLDSSAALFRSNRIASPAVVVVGQVARLHQQLNWLKKEKPLLGRTVVVTRAASQNRSFISKLEDAGAFAVECPTIEIHPLSLDRAAQFKIEQWKTGRVVYDWVVFLSENAVRTFAAAGSISRWPGGRVAAVGPSTAAALKELKWSVHKTGPRFDAQSLFRHLGPLAGKRILLPRVQNAPKDLERNLRARGVDLDVVATYENRPASPPLERLKKFVIQHADAVTFTSASTVRAFRSFFAESEFKALFRRARAVSIGPQTEKALREAGVRNGWRSASATSDALVDTLIKRMP